MRLYQDPINGDGSTLPAVRTRRYETIDIARALAIILVVAGHYDDPRMPQALETVRRVIYMFHMPLFMFASGFVNVATARRGAGYARFIVRKFRRLMVPYFTMSLIIMIIKMATQGSLAVDHPVTAADLPSILWSPVAGYFLWFIWAMWWMMVISPIFHTPGRRLVLLTASLVLHFTADIYPEMFCLRQTAEYLVFFAAGGVTLDLMRRGLKLPRLRFSLPLTTLLFAMAAITLLHERLLPQESLPGLRLLTAFAGVAASFCISAACLRLGSGEMRKLLFSLSSASYIVYLWHTTFMGLAKALLAKSGFLSCPIPLWHWVVAVTVVISCGVIMPWLLDRYVLSRTRMTRFLFGLTRPPQPTPAKREETP